MELCRSSHSADEYCYCDTREAASHHYFAIHIGSSRENTSTPRSIDSPEPVRKSRLERYSGYVGRAETPRALMQTVGSVEEP